MADMQSARRGVAGAGTKAAGHFAGQNTQTVNDMQPGAGAASRFGRAGNATASALRLVRAAGEPGHMPPGELAAGLAAILRARCGPMERLTIASAALMALGRDDAEELAKATLHDLRAACPVRRAS